MEAGDEFTIRQVQKENRQTLIFNTSLALAADSNWEDKIGTRTCIVIKPLKVISTSGGEKGQLTPESDYKLKLL